MDRGRRQALIVKFYAKLILQPRLSYGGFMAIESIGQICFSGKDARCPI